MKAMRHAVLAVAVVAALGGCTKSFWVKQYPEFYSQDIQTVAVLPFANSTGQVGAGELFAERLAAALRANGTYRVIGPADVMKMIGVMSAQSMPAGEMDRLVEVLKKSSGAQAYITGNIVRYQATQVTYVDWDYPPYGYPYYPYSYRWGYGYYDPYYTYYPGYYGYYGYAVPDYRYVTRADVEVDAKMSRLADGKELYSSPRPLTAVNDVNEGVPNQPRTVLLEAVDRCAWEIVRNVAVVPVKITLKPGRDFRTAEGQSEGIWVFRDSFPADAGKMFVVINLPPQAARNSFLLTIAPKDRPAKVLAQEQVIWQYGETSRAVEFSPKKFATATGPGDYCANLYLNGQLLMKRDLRLTKAGD